MTNPSAEKPHIFGLKSIKQEVEPGIYAYCTCGYSSNQPFCDGSHEGTSFQPLKLRVEERRKISWCTCKHTAKAPFCDGTHKALAAELDAHKNSNLP